MGIFEESSVQIVVDGAVSEVVINRPQSLNALNPDVLQGLVLAFERLLKQEHLRAIIVSGSGEKAFVAGADIHSMNQLGPRAIADYIELGQRVMRLIETARVPCIAAVHGYALGGGMELALACDLIVASSLGRFGQPEVNLGIIPGFGGTQRLLQRCGIGTAKRLCLTGEVIKADEAYRLGLVDKFVQTEVVGPEAVLELARGVAAEIVRKAPRAVEEAKRVIRLSGEDMLLAGLRREVAGFLQLFPSADREEGMDAFLKKREPKFTGR